MEGRAPLPLVTKGHDLPAIAERLDELTKQVAYLVERQRKQEELFSEMTPILREVLGVATSRLDALEKDGTLAFGRELVKVGQRVVESYGPDDVRAFGDAVVGILDTVRAVTQPEVLAVAGEASKVLQEADQVEPLGMVGMVRATRSEDVQKGMAVMMDVLRHVGRAAEAMARRRAGSPLASRKAKLDAVTGARRPKALGVERKPAPPPARRAAAASVAAAPAAAPAAEKPAKAAAAVIDGVAFDGDGHLVDPGAWSNDLATRIAATLRVELTEEHWKIVRFAREEFERVGMSPNIRRITQGASLATKDLYALFPKAPARTIAKIAGIPKPAGCI